MSLDDAGRVCDVCDITWPKGAMTYLKCPECGTQTRYVARPTIPVMSDTEAKKYVAALEHRREAQRKADEAYERLYIDKEVEAFREQLDSFTGAL